MDELEELEESDGVDEPEEMDMISETGGNKEKCDLSRMRNMYKNIQSNTKEGEYYCVDYGDQFYVGNVTCTQEKCFTKTSKEIP